jgi:hypothetical protein
MKKWKRYALCSADGLLLIMPSAALAKSNQTAASIYEYQVLEEAAKP